jgi:hypothetical protein
MPRSGSTRPKVEDIAAQAAQELMLRSGSTRPKVEVWAIALLAASCTLGTGTFAGKTCRTNVDCPEPYSCAQVRVEGRTCELLRGVETFDPSSDNPADYCHNVKPILDTNCLKNCHGADQSYPGTRHDFRLDQFADMGPILGAGAKAFNINDRVTKDTMPPVGTDPRPSNADKGVISRWLNSGAPECLDAGM